MSSTAQRRSVPPSHFSPTTTAAGTLLSVSKRGQLGADEPEIPEMAVEPVTPQRSWKTNLLGPAQPRPAGVKRTPVELAHAIKNIDDQERVFGFAAAGVGVVLGILITVLASNDNPALGHKGHASSSLIVLEGAVRIVLSLLVVGSALTRRRAFLGFSLLFLGVALNGIFALPFWGFGAILIWRAYRFQKELQAMGHSPASMRTKKPPRARSKVAATTGPPRPTVSKRYTPPKAKPKPMPKA
jgi:hypothetical protein